MSRAKMFTAIFLAGYAVLNVSATTYYVNASRTDDSGVGTSWDTAKKTIQAAITVSATGDSIIVTNGLYAPIICYDKAITIQSVSGSKTTIIEGGGSNRCAFLGFYSYQTNTVLNGFTLRNGCSSDEGGGSRGGSLVNCTLIGNTAVSGGATRYGVLYNCYLAENIATNGGAASGSILYGCKVEKNVSYQYGGGVLGGTLTSCILNDNLALRQGGGSSNAQLYDCVISNNVAKIEGGGSAYGTLSNCTLSGNMAPLGGGSYLASLNNCILIDNTASRGGGSYDGKLNNCTISGNMASTAGGAYGATLTNCIVWANTAGVDANVSQCSLSYSCSLPLHPGIGNISLDPLLIDSNAGDLRLRTGSPCIDLGTNLPVVGTSDFAGNPRIQGGLIDMGAFEGGTTGNVITITQQGSGGLSHSSLCVEDGGKVSFTATEFGRDFLGFYTNGIFATDERTFIWENITADGSLVAVFSGLYVNASQPDNSGDGLAWATAMQSIQSAVDSSLPGDIIYVTNGVYSPVVAETKLIAIQSVNGADVTIIDGGNTSRCATLGKSSWPYKTSLNGFLLTNGKAPNGGGGGSSYGVLNHCILRSNSSSPSMGGGSYEGILNNCIISRGSCKTPATLRLTACLARRLAG